MNEEEQLMVDYAIGAMLDNLDYELELQNEIDDSVYW